MRRIGRYVAAAAVAACLNTGVAAQAAAASQPATRAHVRLPTTAHRRVIAKLGGTVMLGAARIYVPSGVMRADGNVSITRLSYGRFRFAIGAAWGGFVRITLPLRRGRDAIVHEVGGIWLTEGRQYGKRTVWVSHLSILGTLKSIFVTPFSILGKGAVAAKCIRFTVSTTLKCLAKEGVKSVGGDVLGWIVSQVSHNCAVAITVNNIGTGPLIPLTTLMSIVGFEPACTQQLGSGELPPGYDVNGHPIHPGTPGAGGSSSPPAGGTPSAGPPSNPALSGTPETAGGVLRTWSNPADAGGSPGAQIASGATVLVSCRLGGARVSDGNTWWYRIASRPWSNAFYVSADGFYNNGATEGPLRGTPFVDMSVPSCGSSTPSGGAPGGTTTPPIGPVSVSVSNNSGQMAVQVVNFPTGTTYYFCHAGTPSQYPTGGTVTAHGSINITSPNQSWSSGLCAGGHSTNMWIGFQGTDGHDYYSNQVLMDVPAAPGASASVYGANGQMSLQLTSFPQGTTYFFCHQGPASQYPTGGAIIGHGQLGVGSPNGTFGPLCSGAGNAWIGIQGADGHDYYSNQITL